MKIFKRDLVYKNFYLRVIEKYEYQSALNESNLFIFFYKL